MKAAKQVSSKVEANTVVDNQSATLHDVLVSRAQDIFTRVRDALVVDAKRQRELSDEMHKLSDAYNRYLALRREAKAHEDSANALKALLGPKAFVHALETDKSDALGEELEIFPTVAYLRDSAPLWQHIQQYLRFVAEAQVAEIVEFLDWVGIGTSRQAVEAAIKAHPELFSTKNRGREKFVAVK